MLVIEWSLLNPVIVKHQIIVEIGVLTHRFGAHQVTKQNRVTFRAPETLPRVDSRLKD